jgi:nucleoside-diphosphate-sugar epimerase
MKRVLVTGGAGFIGSHLVRRLVTDGYKVTVLDNFSSGDPNNLAGLGTQIEVREGDIRNAVACRNACRGIDMVFHMAALVSVQQSIIDPVLADSTNTGGTLNMLIAARDHQVRRFVFSSSAAVYGELPVPRAKETMLARPLSPYGIHKLTGEHYCSVFSRLFGLETVGLRYFNVYGPRQNPASEYAAVIPKFITRVLEGQPPKVFGDGEQTRDFCYVGDVVSANVAAAICENQEAIGQAFNVGSGKRVSLNQLLETLQAVCGVEIPAEYLDARPGDIRHSGADVSQARKLLGFRAATGLEKGLKATYRYYLEARRAASGVPPGEAAVPTTRYRGARR